MPRTEIPCQAKDSRRAVYCVDQATALDLPDAQFTIHAGTGDERTIGTERESANCVTVST